MSLLTLLLRNLEVLKSQTELFSSPLIFDSILPLAGFAKFLLSIELFTFFLNDNSIKVTESDIFNLNVSLFNHFLTELNHVVEGINFDILRIFEILVYSENLAILNISAKIIFLFDTVYLVFCCFAGWSCKVSDAREVCKFVSGINGTDIQINHCLRKPMSKTFNENLNIWISEDTCRTMSQSLIQRLVHDWLKSFNYDLDAEIIETIENLSAVNIFQLKSPLAHVNNFVS